MKVRVVRSPHILGNGRTLSHRRTVLYWKQQRILETITAKTVAENTLKDFYRQKKNVSPIPNNSASLQDDYKPVSAFGPHVQVL